MEIIGGFVGRFCPIHCGHQAVIESMIKECGIENSFLVLGSSNAAMSLRNLFSYEERRSFIKRLYPDLQIIGLPDYQTDQEWLTALDDILRFKGISSQDVTFFGGCEEDISFFVDIGRQCKIVNRFDGGTPKISATEVRDALIQERELKSLLNPKIVDEVKKTFIVKWDRFRKM